MELQLFSRL